MDSLEGMVLIALIKYIELAQKIAPLCGFVAGFCGLKAYHAFAREEDGWFKVWGGSFAVAFLLGPATFLGFGSLMQWLGFQGVELPTWQGVVHVAGLILGVVAVLVWGRYVTPHIETTKAKLTRRSDQERNRRTDVREIAKHLPNPDQDYDPLRYMNPAKGVFVGLDEGKKPQYIAQELWRRSHVQVIGTTGAGKGVATGVLLSQALRDGEAVVVLDPKDDEWAPHVLRAECERQGVPFRLIDLRADIPQIDLIDGANADQLEELLVAGFSLAEKGEAADFYRLGDRRGARLAGQLLEEEGEGWTVDDLSNHPAMRKLNADAPGFVGKLDELARVKAVSGCSGHLSRTVAEGGCLYVVGSMRNERVKMAQRMLLVRLLQLVETRDRVSGKPRPVCCFLDELKYHLSRPALEGLGAARDKGLHLVLAHQSLADLRDCPADLDGDAVVGAVVENCAVRIAYRVRDPETATWLASMSGSILVDDESRRIERNAALAELVESERTVRLAERYLVDVNMLLNLPARVAVVFGGPLPFFAHICPLVTAKQQLVIEADDVPQDEPQELIDRQPPTPWMETAAEAPAEAQGEPEAAPWAMDAPAVDDAPEDTTEPEDMPPPSWEPDDQPTLEIAPPKPSKIQTIRTAGDLPDVDF